MEQKSVSRFQFTGGVRRAAVAIAVIAIAAAGIAAGLGHRAYADVQSEPVPKIVGPQPGQVIVVYGETDREAGFPHWGYVSQAKLEPVRSDPCLDLGCFEGVLDFAAAESELVTVSYGESDQQSGLPAVGEEPASGVATSAEIAGLGFIGATDY